MTRFKNTQILMVFFVLLMILQLVYCLNANILVFPFLNKSLLLVFHGLDVHLANQQKIASVITLRFEMGKVATELLLKRLNGEQVAKLTKLPYQIDLGQMVPSQDIK